MLFAVYLFLNVINIILFFIIVFGEDLKIYKFISKLYKFITVPMIFYSVFYILHMIFNRVGIYSDLEICFMMIFTCSVSIISSIGKIIRICFRDSTEIVDPSGFLGGLYILCAMCIAFTILFALILGYIEIDTKNIYIEKEQFKEIVYTDSDDTDDKNQVTVILNENNDKIVIDLDNYTLEEFEYNRKEKYIKKSAKYSKSVNIFGMTHESEKYIYTIYTGDEAEYELLKKVI